MALNGKNRVPWSDKLRRIRADVPNQAEWMAPDSVVEQARQDYLAALDWLHDSALRSWSQQRQDAPQFLTETFLKQHQATLRREENARAPRCVAVLRADHQVMARRFSEDGERCLIIDQQLHRRMATYDYDARTRIHTQDLGACAVVVEMVYDKQSQRWKIAAFIQRLPMGWGNPRVNGYIDLLVDLPTGVGRDS
jgi:hypothetical protein